MLVTSTKGKVDLTIIVGGYIKNTSFMEGAIYSAKNQIKTGWRHGKLPRWRVVEAFDSQGIGAAKFRNVTIAALGNSSEWIYWLDADDLLPSHWLINIWAEIVDFRNSYKHLVAYSPVQFISGCRPDMLDCVTIPRSNFPANFPVGINGVFRKKSWETLEGFDESLINMSDLDFWLRLDNVHEHNTDAGSYTKFANAEATFLLRRDVPGSLSKLNKDRTAAVLAQFNKKHKTRLKTKMLPYLVPRTDLI